MEELLIYYDDNTNMFKDEYGTTETTVVDIMTYDDMMHYKKVGGIYRHDLGGVMYVIDFPVNNDRRLFMYDSIANVIYDEGGAIVFNIFSIITPNELYIFKLKKESIVLDMIDGGLVELQYCTEPCWVDID
jgi:hypothetical protein